MEFLILRENVSTLDNVKLILTWRISILSSFILRKLDVKLGVIGKTVEMDVEFSEINTKGKDINDQEKGPQDKAMGHTCGDRGRLGSE